MPLCVWCNTEKDNDLFPGTVRKHCGKRCLECGAKAKSAIMAASNIRRTRAMPTEKLCKRCGEVKPAIEFSIRKIGSLAAHCKICVNVPARKATSDKHVSLHIAGERACPICKIVKPLSAFEHYPGQYGTSQLKYPTGRCSDCTRFAFAKKRHEIKLQVFDLYSEGTMQCRRCGCSDIRTLSLDHINNDGAIRRRNGEAECGKYARMLKEKPSGL